MRNVTFLASCLIVLCAIEGCAQTPERLATPVTSQPVDATQDNPYSVKASDSGKEGAVNSEQQAPSKRPQEVKGGSKPKESIGTLGVIGLFFKSFAMAMWMVSERMWDCYEAHQGVQTAMYIDVLTGKRVDNPQQVSKYNDMVEQGCRGLDGANIEFASVGSSSGYAPPPQVISSGASGYVPPPRVITRAPSKVTPAPSVVTRAGGKS